MSVPSSPKIPALPASTTRRHDLDGVRVGAFLLLILYHVGMFYVSWDWHVKSPFAGPGIEPLMFLTSPWRLSLLFFVSGVASAFLLDKAPRGFLWARSWRLLVPLVFGMLVVVPPQAYLEVMEKLPGGYHDGYLAFWGRYLAADRSFCFDGQCLDLPTWNHLWFVAYLWVYTVLLSACMRLAPRTVARAREAASRHLAGVAIVLAPMTLLALSRLTLVARFPSTHALIGDGYNHAQYFPVFALGFLIAKAESVWDAIERMRWSMLALAVLGYAFLAWYFCFSGYDDAHPAPDRLRMIQRVAWGIEQWSAILAILGFARHAKPGDSPALRYLTHAVFPLCILHQTVIVVVAHALKPWAMAPLAEGVVLIAATFALCLLGVEIIRRVPPLRPLFGLPFRSRRNHAGDAGPTGATEADRA